MKISWKAFKILSVAVALASFFVMCSMRFTGEEEVKIDYQKHNNSLEYGDYAYASIVGAVPIISEVESQLYPDEKNYYYIAYDESGELCYLYVTYEQAEEFNNSLNSMADKLYVSGKIIQPDDSVKDVTLEDEDFLSAQAEGVDNYLETMHSLRAIGEEIAASKVIQVDLSEPQTITVNSGIGQSSYALVLFVLSIVMIVVVEMKEEKELKDILKERKELFKVTERI